MSEAEGVSKRFDPRFSPAFQPGYDPRVHREEPPRSLFRGQVPVRHDEMISEPPGFAVPATDSSVDLREAAGSGVNSSALSELSDGPLAWWHRVNPWFVALWVLGIVFIAAGVGIVLGTVNSQLAPNPESGTSQLYFIFLQTAWTSSPMLITLGLATIISTLVIKAARWGRR